MKDEFFDDLQVVISSTPPDDLLLVMGDFNARVGCGDDMDPSWLGVKGKFGVGRLNENGEHLLTFCAMCDEHHVCKEGNLSVYMATSWHEDMF